MPLALLAISGNMADDITSQYTTEFSGHWIPRAQQMRTRLSEFIEYQDFQGERKRFSRTGVQRSRLKTERKADTVPVNPTTDFRWIGRRTYELPNDLDEDDEEDLGVLVLPTGQWTKDHASAFSRDKDDVGWAAALGSAVTGEDGTSTTALPAAQQIAAGGTGLTITKLRTANQILMEADLEGAEMGSDGMPNASNRVIVCTAEQINNLLGTVEIGSADYNTVKALSEGNVNTFMGFTFRRIEDTGGVTRLTKVSTTRSCVAWVKGAIYGSVGRFTTDISRIKDKSNKILIRSTWRLGAVRIHDEGVVQIDCTETA